MKSKLTGLLALALAIPVLASPPTGTWATINSDFGAGNWTEILTGGPSGTPGNEWQLTGDSYQLDGAPVTGTVLTGSGLDYAQYLTTCAGGVLTLANTVAEPWYNAADTNTTFTITLGTLEVTTRTFTNSLGIPTGQVEFTIKAEGVAADDATVGVVFEAGYAGIPTLDASTDPAVLLGSLEWATLAVTAPPPVVKLVVDIKAGSAASPVNLSSRGVIPVVIKGSADFDVRLIDPATIRLEGVAPVRWTLVGLALAGSDTTITNGDGFADLKLKFKTAQLAAVLGDVPRNTRLTLTLTAQLLDGSPAEGTDTIRVLKSNRKPPNPHKK